MAFDHRVVGPHADGLGIVKLAAIAGDVLGHIDQHGAGTAGGGNVEGLFHGGRQVFDVLDQEIVFDTGSGDANGVAFLEGIQANGMRGHLTRDDDHGNRVHVGRGNTGHGIGQAWPAGHNADTGLFAGARIGVGCMNSRLLVSHQDVLDLVLLKDFVVDVEHGATGVAKKVLNLFFLETLHQDFCACHFHMWSVLNSSSNPRPPAPLAKGLETKDPCQRHRPCDGALELMDRQGAGLVGPTPTVQSASPIVYRERGW